MVNGFNNRKDYGFNEDGHIYGIIRLHEAYIGAGLTHQDAPIVEKHIRECESCLVRWELLTDRILRPLPARH